MHQHIGQFAVIGHGVDIGWSSLATSLTVMQKPQDTDYNAGFLMVAGLSALAALIDRPGIRQEILELTDGNAPLADAVDALVRG